jgi:single-strand DNA-binding protein
VVAWEKTAEFIAKYFRKGQQIAIEGRLQTRSYEDNEGKKRFVMEVLAEQVHFAGEKKEGQQEEFRPEEYTIENDDELPF